MSAGDVFVDVCVLVGGWMMSCWLAEAVVWALRKQPFRIVRRGR